MSKAPHQSRFGCMAASTWLASLGITTASLSGCSIDTLQSESRPAVANSCKSNDECGANGICTEGACYSRSGAIDEVLLEIIPEANSPLGRVSFLSMQNGLERGSRNRAIALSGPITIPVQVLVNAESLKADCPYQRTGKPSVAARIEFVRTGSVSGVSVAGLSKRFSTTIDTEANAMSGYGKDVALVPGFYDIYAQPVSYPNCQIPPKLWRGVEVDRDGIVAWAPPATLELPVPITLNGRVERSTASLEDWQVDIIDPQEEKVISTSAKLGVTTQASPFTNFEITLQLPEHVTHAALGSSPDKPGAAEPLIRLRPPKGAEGTAPTVYFELGAAAATGAANLVVSKLPAPWQLVDVSGQVRGVNSGEGVRSTVKFFNSNFLKELGLPAAYGRAVPTDPGGGYATKLFPGTYRVVVIPEGATADAKKWALTEQQVEVIGSGPTQTVDVTVAQARVLEGMASAGRDNVPAQGATLEAAPRLESSPGVWSGLTSPPTPPAQASVPVDDTNGKFKLFLDPGNYDFSLKPASASNFAWWIWPDVTVLPVPPSDARPLEPQLLYPVPLAGTITVAQQNTPTQPLRNATVQAYARVSIHSSAVVQVGTARTDDTGHYYLALPPRFGTSTP